MTTQQFVEAAIEGGYEPPRGYNCQYCPDTFCGSEPIKFHTMILDPKAWEAVGKMKGWKDEENFSYRVSALNCEHPIGIVPEFIGPEWFYHIHQMVKSLTEGKTIEEFIATL